MAGRAKENLPGGSLKKKIYIYIKKAVYLDVVTACRLQRGTG